MVGQAWKAAIHGVASLLTSSGGDPTPRQYGPVPATDGDATPYLFTWDASAEEYVQLEG